jgi:hypothetical protein
VFLGLIFYSGKLIPWFVSDVTPPDWRETFEVLLDSGFFPNDSNTENIDHLLYMAKRWKGYVTDGTFQLSVPVDTPLGGPGDSEFVKASSFWTTPFPYWNMKVIAPTLWNHLAESGLVIFKVRNPSCCLSIKFLHLFLSLRAISSECSSSYVWQNL